MTALEQIAQRMDEEIQERNGQALVYRNMREWSHEEASIAEARVVAKWVKELRAAIRQGLCETCAHWTMSTQECAALKTGPLNVIYTAPDFGCVKHKERS